MIYGMLLSEFDYELPPELIAQTPLDVRSDSRLMVLDPQTQTIAHHRFYELGEFLHPGDALIFNDTRVIPARLIGKRDTGGKAEVFLLHRLDTTRWEVLVKPGRRLKPGSRIIFGPELSCRITDVTDYGGRIAEFSFDGIFEEILAKLGQTPLPPYIHEQLDDPERYQTVYNRVDGSAAAPTAGLHFTVAEMDNLRAAGVKLGFITLHVGLGTFRPVEAERIEDHVMHREFYHIPAETAALIAATKAQGGRVVAVGTTSVRTLEAVAAKGNGSVAEQSDWTNIFIYPGYKFQIVDGMITNFHLPKSSLIMLVSAFAGQEFVFRAYAEAVREKYRFFSFGDAMFITNRG